MSTLENVSKEDLKNPDYVPPLQVGVILGLQHVLAMFVSNVTPSIIIAGVAGFAFGSADTVFLIQMSMLFAGIATLMQTIGFGPVGARLPVMQGTSFAFVPVMIGAAKMGMGTLFGGIVIGGLFHAFMGLFIGKIRHWFPPLVSGIIILAIGIYLIPVGIQYAAGGAGDFNMSKPTWGGLGNWSLAIIVILVSFGLKFWTKGIISSSSVLLGMIVAYVIAIFMGDVNFSGVSKAAWFALPEPFKYGFDINLTVIIAMCLMSIVSAIETVGDISGIAKGGANREATDKELQGGTYADGIGTAVAGIFGGLPNTSFSQNVGLISMTGVMSRSVVTIAAIFLILCGLVPKIGALVSSMPIAVLGGGVIVMFGMVASAGINMLSSVNWNRRNMMIFAISLSIGFGLQKVPASVQGLGGDLQMLMTSGLLPAAFLAVLLNIILPEEGK
jgi:NCS2 family nucleobase:cation symporter-2